MIKICLDAGHGLNTSGKQTPDGVKEWTMNHIVVTEIKALLSKYKSVEVTTVYDESGKTDTSLSDRMKRVKSIKPHLFLSIHHNALKSTWGDWTGVEAYAHPKAPAIDKTLAGKFAHALSKKVALHNRGKKESDFYVLRECPVSTPAVLIEGGFMDSKIDHPVITSREGQKAYAASVVEVIVEQFKLELREPVTNEKQTLYRVIVASYLDKNTANAEKTKLQKEYPGAWVETIQK